MMELYLNIIEFGPDVYGVEQAAEHYFGRRPEELDLAECLFLSSIMPSAHPLQQDGGARHAVRRLVAPPADVDAHRAASRDDHAGGGSRKG